MKHGDGFNLTVAQLREAIDFANPDGPDDEDQQHTELVIGYLEDQPVSDDGEQYHTGWFAWLAEYPEEGCIPLDWNNDSEDAQHYNDARPGA